MAITGTTMAIMGITMAIMGTTMAIMGTTMAITGTTMAITGGATRATTSIPGPSRGRTPPQSRNKLSCDPTLKMRDRKPVAAGFGWIH